MWLQGNIVKIVILIGIKKVLILCLFVLSGCSGDKKVKVLKCGIEKDVTESMHLESEYLVYYKGKYVNLIKTTETLSSKDMSPTLSVDGDIMLLNIDFGASSPLKPHFIELLPLSITIFD